MDCHIGTDEGGGFRWQRVKALWDTGTSTTVITPEVASKLKLKPHGTARTNGLGGVRQSCLARAFVGFPNHKVYGPIAVVVDTLPSTDVLIGMDVISIGTFTIRRKPDGGTLFTFDMNV